MAEFKFDVEKMAHSVVARLKQQGMFVSWWIPVSEKLPKEENMYLVSGKYLSGKIEVNECWFDIDFENVDGSFDAPCNYEVIAWMPLPLPWKGE